jgi:hypothetical protein
MKLIRSGLILLVDAKYECSYNKLKIKAGNSPESSLLQIGLLCPIFHKKAIEKPGNEVNQGWMLSETIRSGKGRGRDLRRASSWSASAAVKLPVMLETPPEISACTMGYE